jgi:hypothetical protein
LRAGIFSTRTEPFDVAGKEFNDGLSAGLGRISIGGKLTLAEQGAIAVAFSPDLFFPSPSQAEFAGSDSFAILPRVVAQYDLFEAFRVHLDVGYDYDFEVSELTRFVWNLGGSIAASGILVDFGVGGSEFDSPVRWTSRRAMAEPTPSLQEGVELRSQGDITLDTSFIDFLGGFKLRLPDSFVVGASINVPVMGDGFRPDVFGTVALEKYF